ncbi:MAG: hypothetical protein BRC25_01700 [Parcubacteria group bacterium SW_6_46_9]|nr:MAG: hypothetical protein BRC25_01700 [Parcubacteria group bacterium SW_6_46_9]
MFSDQPIGRSILGTTESVQQFERNDLLTYKRVNYAADNTVVVTAGGVNPNPAHKQIKNQFSSAKNTQTQDPQPAQPNPNNNFSFRRKDSDQTHLIVGGLTVARDSEKLPAVEILSTVLGRGMSSRLFQKLRDEMGVCYYVRSSASYFTDAGLFKVSTGVTPGRLTEVITEIKNSLISLAENGVEAEELQKAKEFAAGNFLLSQETTDGRARDVAKQAILDASIEKPREYTKKLRDVSAGEIKQAAADILKQNLHAAAIGPDSDKQAVENVLQ